VWSGVQQTPLSDATQVLVAQSKPVVMCFTFMPAVQAVIVEQDALAVQQVAAVLPTVPHFAGSLNWAVVQVTVATLHLEGSSTQHAPSSEEAHVELAQ
jgi:hypothetical protein